VLTNTLSVPELLLHLTTGSFSTFLTVLFLLLSLCYVHIAVLCHTTPSHFPLPSCLFTCLPIMCAPLCLATGFLLTSFVLLLLLLSLLYRCVTVPHQYHCALLLLQWFLLLLSLCMHITPFLRVPISPHCATVSSYAGWNHWALSCITVHFVAVIEYQILCTSGAPVISLLHPPCSSNCFSAACIFPAPGHCFYSHLPLSSYFSSFLHVTYISLHLAIVYLFTSFL
jgi:hypothetical protein